MDNNFDRLETVLRLEGEPDRIPFYDLFADPEVIEAVTGQRLPAQSPSQVEGTESRMVTLSSDQVRSIAGAEDQQKIMRDIERSFKVQADFYLRLGYDYVVLHLPSPFPRWNVLLADDTAPLTRRKRTWQNENRGTIESREDFKRYCWPDLDEIECACTLLLSVMKRILPQGVKIIPLTPGGVLENVMWLMGAVNFFKALYTDRSLIEDMFQKIGPVISFYCDICSEDESVGAMSMGDDMGYKTGPMIHPDYLRRYVFPWHKRCVENVHRHGKPFILHSCGNLKIVMNDLIEYVGIDAKHSYEDTSYPVTEYKRLYGDRIAVLGGVDMDKLTRAPLKDFEGYVRNIIYECAPGGGYALGCGNTAANYIRLENYLTMFSIGRRYGRYPLKR
ncbi:MAG: uroporphyrinogen decarboxylase family protein [Candidatus Bathyarchaeia archaeon]